MALKAVFFDFAGTLEDVEILLFGRGGGDIVAEDFDEDGSMDLAAVSPTGITVFLNRTGSFSTDANVNGVPDECEAAFFIRGDTNDDGILTISDVVTVIFQLAGLKPIECADASDVGDNGTIELADAVILMRYQFARGAPPEAPFPDCGKDVSPDDPLHCESPPPCQ